MRTALFLAYQFPPVGGVATRRALAFARHLPAHGWRAVVVTSAVEDHALADPSLLHLVPESTVVHRVRGYDPNALRTRAERIGLGRPLTALNVAMSVPDAAALWARRARRVVLRVVEEHAPEVIWSTSGPGSAHLLARWTARRTGLPWVADFRDAWSTNPNVPRLPGYRALVVRWERQVLADADRIVAVTPGFAAEFSALAGRPVERIENGYEPEETLDGPPPRGTRLTLLYTGTLGRNRPLRALVEAVDALDAEGKVPRDRLRIVFAGRGFDRRVPQGPPYEVVGFLPRADLAELRRAAHVFLLVHSPHPGFRSSHGAKLFEYLAGNRPVLAVAPRDCAAAALIRETRAGLVVPHEPAEIALALSDLYAGWQIGAIPHDPDRGRIAGLSFAAHGERLARMFDELVNR